VFDSEVDGVGVDDIEELLVAVLLGELVGVLESLTDGVAVALAVFVVEELGVSLGLELGVVLAVLLILTDELGVLLLDTVGVLENEVLGVGVEDELGVVLGVGEEVGVGETQITFVQVPHVQVPKQSGSPKGSGQLRPSRGSISLRNPSTGWQLSTVQALLSS